MFGVPEGQDELLVSSAWTHCANEKSPLLLGTCDQRNFCFDCPVHFHTHLSWHSNVFEMEVIFLNFLSLRVPLSLVSLCNQLLIWEKIHAFSDFSLTIFFIINPSYSCRRRTMFSFFCFYNSFSAGKRCFPSRLCVDLIVFVYGSWIKLLRSDVHFLSNSAYSCTTLLSLSTILDVFMYLNTCPSTHDTSQSLRINRRRTNSPSRTIITRCISSLVLSRMSVCIARPPTGRQIVSISNIAYNITTTTLTWLEPLVSWSATDRKASKNQASYSNLTMHCVMCRVSGQIRIPVRPSRKQKRESWPIPILRD